MWGFLNLVGKLQRRFLKGLVGYSVTSNVAVLLNPFRRSLGRLWSLNGSSLSGAHKNSNVDVDVKKDVDFSGVGAIIRDDQGSACACLARKLVGMFSSYAAECLALREGLKFVAAYGLPVSVMETDAVNVVTSC